MNLETKRLRWRPINKWQDEMWEDGRLIGGKGWKERVYNREKWKKLLRMARNRRILHMPVEWILYCRFASFIILCVYFIYITVHFSLFIFTITCNCSLTTVIRLQCSLLFSTLSAVALKLLYCVVNVHCRIWIFVSYFSFYWSVRCDVTVCWWWTCSIHASTKFKMSTSCTSLIFTRRNDMKLSWTNFSAIWQHKIQIW